MRRVLIAAILSLTLVSCNKVTAPTTSNVEGTWSGTITSAQLGSAAFSFSIIESATSSVRSGAWSTSYTNTALNSNGSLLWTLSDTNLTLAMTPTVTTQCFYNFTGTLDGSSSVTGTFTAFNCATPPSGTFSATKPD